MLAETPIVIGTKVAEYTSYAPVKQILAVALFHAGYRLCDAQTFSGGWRPGSFLAARLRCAKSLNHKSWL